MIPRRTVIDDPQAITYTLIAHVLNDAIRASPLLEHAWRPIPPSPGT